MAGKRRSLAALVDEPVETVPGHSAGTHTIVKPDKIAPTPLNARLNFGTPADLEQLGESIRIRQLSPVVVVSRTDYLRIFPEHADNPDIASADYVLVNGERRLRAARQVELPHLEMIERPQLADSRADFLDALYAENLDRLNFDVIEEARAVEAMVAECGTAAAAAKRFRRGEAWVSQRRALLKLSPALQDCVRSGELPVRIARSIASLPHSEQEAAWHAAVEAEEAQRAGRTEESPQPGDGRGSPDPSGPAGGAPEPGDGRDDEPEPDEAGPGSTREHDPEPEDSGDEDPDLYRSKDPAEQETAGDDVLPWYSPADLARVIKEKLEPEAVDELVELLTSG